MKRITIFENIDAIPKRKTGKRNSFEED